MVVAGFKPASCHLRTPVWFTSGLQSAFCSLKAAATPMIALMVQKKQGFALRVRFVFRVGLRMTHSIKKVKLRSKWSKLYHEFGGSGGLF